jgi:hypothetical protein
MPSQKLWRVLVKRARRAHLTRFVAEEGSGSIALCGKNLPQDERRCSAKTIIEPDGDECRACLLLAGYKIERRSLHRDRKKEPVSRQELRLKGLLKLANLITSWDISDEKKRAAIEAIVRTLPD